MRETDIKLLWGRAAARCAVCGTKLTQDKSRANESFPLGEHAHIVGDRPGSARYDEALSDEERDGYTNRVLLCPNDHRAVDRNEADWPVSRLHMKKAEHELLVEQTLSAERNVSDEADVLIYSDLMDSATEQLRLASFSDWASNVLEPYWRWRGDTFDGVDVLRMRVFKTEWPGVLPALEVALDRASFELQEATALFAQYSELDDDDFVARRRYKATTHPPDVYAKLDSDFWLWSDTLEARIVEATRALNWAREVWRAEENPMWLATEGWFVLTLHPDMSMRYGLLKPTYSEEEKKQLLAAGVGTADIRPPRVERRD